MFSDKEQEYAAKLIQRIAQAHNVTQKQVRAGIAEACRSAIMNPDPEVQARWAAFRYAGAEPTAEEFLLWIVTQAVSRTDCHSRGAASQ